MGLKERVAKGIYIPKELRKNVKTNKEKHIEIKKYFKDGDWIFGIGKDKGCSEVFTGDSGDFQPFDYLNNYNHKDFRLATKEEIDNVKSQEWYDSNDKDRKAFLKEKFLEYIEYMIGDFGYSEIDGFAIDNELSDEEIKYVLSIPLKVVEDK